MAERCILAVIFDDRTTIGMVRLYAKESGDRLKEIITESAMRDQTPSLDPEFSRSAESRIDNMFQE